MAQPDDVHGVLAGAAEAVEVALERLLDSGRMGSMSTTLPKVSAILDDATSGLSEADFRIVVSMVVAQRMFRSVADRIRREGVFHDADA